MNRTKFDIPMGDYCYEAIFVDNKTGNIKIEICPYWYKDQNYPYQANGYCSYLNIGDWEDEGHGLLWDMVKECGVNNEE